MEKYKPLSVRINHAQELKYKNQIIMFFVKATAVIILVWALALIVISDDVHAMFGWQMSSAQERYNEAEENYSNAIKLVESAQKQLLERKGDLAFEKLEEAVEERNIEEIDRLNTVISEIQAQMQQDFPLQE